MDKPLRIIFAGTPDFAVPALQALLRSPHQLCAVYTQPDRPAGRGRKLSPSAVKICALDSLCPVLQPVSLRDSPTQAELAAFNADVMVVVAYGKILPDEVLTAPRYGCLNIHASLLPRWRGAAPIQRALLNGDSTTGVTIIQMDCGLDTGDILHSLPRAISDQDTSQTLHQKLAQDGAKAMMHVLKQIQLDDLKPLAQDDSAAIYADKLQKHEARIDWSQSAQALHRRVRAFLPWPVAETQWRGQRLRIWQSTPLDCESPGTPGEVISADKEGIDVATGKGVLRLLQVQLPGGKTLSADQFVNANPLGGERFISLPVK
jgi:methionyl-tRNA formyltransferase